MRIATEHSRLAMPETMIGLFPDVGGGWFLSRCPGRLGEYLALTGQVLGAVDAIEAGLANLQMASADLPMLIEALSDQPMASAAQVLAAVHARAFTPQASPEPTSLPGGLAAHRDRIDHHFAQPSLQAIAESLAHDASPWAQASLGALNQRSPLMMAVTLEQIRRARTMTLADELRMERGLVRHCFHLREEGRNETIEGIRALAVDKDHAPRWQPSRIGEIHPDEVMAFFDSPWPAHAHPLRALGA